MEQTTSRSVPTSFTRQRIASADLLALSEVARQKALQYNRCFAQLEEVIATLNGAKRHSFRVQLRALEAEFKAAIDELAILELQLCRIHQGLSPQGAVIQDDLSARTGSGSGLAG